MEKKVNLGHVLVLEDEPFISLDMEQMLRECGAAMVTTFGTRTEALAWLNRNQPDVAVVDPRLSDGVCADVVERLLAEDVPLVICSGASIDDPAFQRGAWLDKPTTPDALRDTLKGICKSKM
jgi:CheY-like chemotaxis protein